MKYLIVLLLTALLSTHISAIPTPKSYFRRNENATILELIAQYKQFKLQADQAEDLKIKFLEQAESKKISIENKIGFMNDSPGAAKSSSSEVEPFTILTATGTAIVFASHGTIRTVTLNVTAPAAPGPASTIPASTTPVGTAPPGNTLPSATSSAEPYSVLAATGSVVVFVSQEITKTVTLNSTSTSSVARANTSSAIEPVTILTATGSAIVLVSQETTQTAMLNVTPSPTAGGS